MWEDHYRHHVRRFGFELLEMIGEGAFGSVWKARQLGIPAGDSEPAHAREGVGSDLVAIKLIEEAHRVQSLPATVTNDTTARSSFLMDYRRFIRREFANATKLRGNPNIVTVFASDSFPSPADPDDLQSHFVAMELMQGTLQKAMCNKAMTITDRVRIALDAARALLYAHSQKIAHRDIKPANLLIANAAHWSIKIGDFGLSCDYAASMRSGRPWVGTPPYVAPEIFHFAEASTGAIPPDQFAQILSTIQWSRADTYSLGVTLYELFVGSPPYTMDVGIAKRVSLLQKREYKRPSELPHVPATVADIIEQMLLPTPTDRPSLALVCARLEVALGDCLVEFNRDSVGLAPGLSLSIARMVRGSLRKKIEDIVQRLTPDLTPPQSIPDSHADWYLNVLLRPTQRPDDADAVMCDYLCPVHGVHFFRDQPKDLDHWDQSRDLVTRHVSITDSCCGLPIAWFDHKDDLVGRGLLSSRSVHVQTYENRGDVVSYVRIRDLWDARFGDPPNPVISRIYKTDSDNGWNYRPIGHPTGPIHRMRQDVQTEIVVPIYGPSRRRHKRSPEDICGILNIEWTWPIDEKNLARIEQSLVEKIHIDRVFPISEFLSEIVSIVTTLRY